MDAALVLSARLGPLGPRVEGLVRSHRELWASLPETPPPAGRVYGRREKRDCERDLSEALDRLSEAWRETSSGPRADPAADAARLEALAERVRPGLLSVAARAGLAVSAVYDARMVDATRSFVTEARDFDPGLDIGWVYQALRNVWIMNTLQSYLGVEVGLTGPVFAYSLVYPYLDNLLDDASLPAAAKVATLSRLRGWLEDGTGRPEGRREECLRGLVARVEQAFPRPEYPGVYRSMLAIFNAQVRSLRQQAAAASPPEDEVLAISFEKGGTSVLADGYLVAGRLSPRQEDFCFALGAVLQLNDDLQDVAEDARKGHTTLFWRPGPSAPRDGAACRFLRFAEAALRRTLDGGVPRERDLREVILRACRLMTLEAAGARPGNFSRHLARRFEAEFPVRFRWLRKLRRTLGPRFAAGGRTIADLDPVTAVVRSVSARAFSLD